MNAAEIAGTVVGGSAVLGGGGWLITKWIASRGATAASLLKGLGSAGSTGGGTGGDPTP